ncbi:MAG: helix-turn-helix transcriptional regulator [Oscillospiraceae bacterium]|nr:helix-turn-helix transcriptional regulator [Oscillospiraceae bacterium]
MKINKELMKGSTATLVLALLNKEDMYGYRITQEIKKRSDNTFDMKEGTLYPMLHSLEKDGAVESYWFDTEEGRRRKYYKITNSGREMLNLKQKEWSFFMNAMNSILGEECYG